ncbi:hypothetical protein [Reyranella sp.]|uniref:hypothetical protein n=1 Tax=Reyranella sp. TaxID=1929291 RepID=UPI003D097786
MAAEGLGLEAGKASYNLIPVKVSTNWRTRYKPVPAISASSPSERDAESRISTPGRQYIVLCLGGQHENRRLFTQLVEVCEVRRIEGGEHDAGERGVALIEASRAGDDPLSAGAALAGLPITRPGLGDA